MRREELAGDRIYLIHGYFTPEECCKHIEQSEAIGFDDAPITTRLGPVMRKDVRNNTRVILDSTELAEREFQRARNLLPPVRHGWQLSGLNERFRYYRYEQGQTFRPHLDGSFRRSDTEHSLVTLMIYLNDDFTGGATRFYDRNGWLQLEVKPVQGTALIFDHPQLHEGAPVETGRKYVLRTDVMYAAPTQG